jgi:hypothetical protein
MCMRDTLPPALKLEGHSEAFSRPQEQLEDEGREIPAGSSAGGRITVPDSLGVTL